MEIKKLWISLLVPQLIGGIGAIATTPKIKTWYLGLNKPFFSPPNWVFGPVWTTLFILMGLAFYRYWTNKKQRSDGKKWFGIQLGLNLLWSWIFFGGENPALAFVEIIGLWWAIKITIQEFRKVDKLAGSLLLPYWGWVSFASLLNLSVWWLNR